MKSQRLDMIEEYVLEHKNASLDTLCEKFNVSKNTIRRDVDILLKRGSIMKVYGGVAALETPQTLPLLSYEERGGRFPDEKKEICRRAAELVAEDDTIYIDTGTTCLNLVDFIADKHCTILTNSLLIFNKAASYPNLDIISVPGKLNRKTLSFTGPDINDYLQTYNISMAFMACTGERTYQCQRRGIHHQKSHCRECQQHDPSCRPFQIRPDLSYDLFFHGKAGRHRNRPVTS